MPTQGATRDGTLPAGYNVEDQIPFFGGTRTLSPKAVTERVVCQGGPYGQAVVARDTERK